VQRSLVLDGYRAPVPAVTALVFAVVTALSFGAYLGIRLNTPWGEPISSRALDMLNYAIVSCAYGFVMIALSYATYLPR